MLAATVALLLVSACDDDPGRKDAPAALSTPQSRPASDGVAPEADAIVARDGDHILVIVDIAPKDAQGREVEQAWIDPGGAESRASASRPVAPGAPLTIELRVPAATRQVTLTGTSAGGASWSRVLPTALDG
jgi:hypothetical protein